MFHFNPNNWIYILIIAICIFVPYRKCFQIHLIFSLNTISRNSSNIFMPNLMQEGTKYLHRILLLIILDFQMRLRYHKLNKDHLLDILQLLLEETHSLHLATKTLYLSEKSGFFKEVNTLEDLLWCARKWVPLSGIQQVEEKS